MRHENYYEVKANSYYELGLHLGALFKDYVELTLTWCREEDEHWSRKLHDAKHHLYHAKKHFPHLVDELRGYANGANVDFDEVWLLCMEDELDDTDYEKCTTLVTNGGALIAHNEDWDESAKNGICLLKKTIRDLTIFELYYLNTLGGNAISINSHGFVHAINSLSHRDYRAGIPRNVLARWLSETRDPEDDIRELAGLPRSAGYHHTILSQDGRLWSLECSAKKQVLTRPKLPFTHTNHFLSDLQPLEADDNSTASQDRYQQICSVAQDPMSLDTVKAAMSDSSAGSERSVFNERTIARMILDLNEMQVHAWMLGETEKGWITYDLDFITS